MPSKCTLNGAHDPLWVENTSTLGMKYTIRVTLNGSHTYNGLTTNRKAHTPTSIANVSFDPYASSCTRKSDKLKLPRTVATDVTSEKVSMDSFTFISMRVNDAH